MEFEGFMYLDIEHPVVAWNVYRGVLISRRLVEEARGGTPLSMTAARLFMQQDLKRLTFEAVLEAYRIARCPEKVSRMTGLFVFSEPESALAAADDKAWGGHISTDFLTDVGVSAAPNLTRLDGNWISWMLQEYQSDSSDWHLGTAPYWAGEVCPHFKAPIWEILVEGAITIWGTDLKKRAYKVIREREPLTVSLLEQSRLAASLGSDLGHINAFLTEENGRPLISFLMDFADATNKAYTDKLAEYIQTSPPGSVNFADLAVGGNSFRRPNLAMYSYAFHEVQPASKVV